MMKKKTENETFNYEDFMSRYKYLDELTLEGWLWEFLRRNKQYQELYKSYLERKEHFDGLEWWQKVYDEETDSYVRETTETEVEWVKLQRKLKQFRIRWFLYPKKDLWPLDPDKTALEIGLQLLKKSFLWEPPVKILFFGEKKEEEFNFDADKDACPPDPVVCSNIDFDPYEGIVKIDFGQSKRRLLPLLNKMISNGKHRLKASGQKPNSPMKRWEGLRDRWKHNLVCWELKKVCGMAHKDIHDLLNPTQKHSGEHKFDCCSCRDVKTYCKNTKLLINGKYKEYLKYREIPKKSRPMNNSDQMSPEQ